MAAQALQTAVDATTSAMAAVSLSPGETKDTAAQELSAAEGRRLYIGNLAYSTTEDELKKFFEGYNVESVSIPTNPRTARAVGYAFVDVATKEEADRAIDDLSGKEVLDRKVSVQVARRPGTAAPATVSEGEQNNTNGEQTERAPRRGRGGARARGGRGRGSGRRRGEGGRGGEEGTAAPVSEVSPTPAAAETTLTPAAAGTQLTSEDAAGESKAPKENRAPKKRGPPENGVPSTTKVMVANLPYELTEESLKELFAAYNPESAKIALRPIPRFMVRKLQARNEPRKGRGFGFVTLSSEEMQQKAVAEMNGKMIQDREIAVKVAIDNPKIEGQEENEDSSTAGEAVPKETDATPVLAS